MKKFRFVVLLAGLALASCKKEYSCDCTSTVTFTDNGFSYTQYFKNESTPYSQKLSEKQAESVCDHEEETIASTLRNNITANGTQPFPPEIQLTVGCNLK